MKILVCLIIVITLATIYLSDAQQETNGCNTNCSTEYGPAICATNDEGDKKTFPSECIMKSENCKNKSKYVKTGPINGIACP